MSTNVLSEEDIYSSYEISELLREARLPWHLNYARGKLLNWLSDIKTGTVSFCDSKGKQVYGDENRSELDAKMVIYNQQFYRHLFHSGALGVAESYLQKQWSTDDLTALLRILYRNSQQQPTSLWSTKVLELYRRASAWFAPNTREGSQKHIAAHYDLSNEFFKLFLDPTMMYSAAFFPDSKTTLHEASVNKIDRICKKLELKKEDHLLEIGTGWGGFSERAAKQFGCNITTTTISEAQFSEAKARFSKSGLDQKINLLKTDYRDLTGQFDKLVSIEMIEAVGFEFLDEYFKQCGRLLKPGGRFVLQGIIMPEDRFDLYRKGIDFIQKYIFPGGFLPSISAMQNSIGRTSNLRLVECEDLSNHYATTLEKWRNNFFKNIDSVRSLGFDDRFIRMWEYYLCYCEAAFLEKAVQVVQIVWERPAH